jgi:hypothetical protein
MRKRTEARLVDRMISAHVDWHEACRLVNDAYGSWVSAAGPRARVAFWRYTAALEAEEWAAEAYASLVRRVERRATSNGELSRTRRLPTSATRAPQMRTPP